MSFDMKPNSIRTMQGSFKRSFAHSFSSLSSSSNIYNSILLLPVLGLSLTIVRLAH